MVKAKLLMVKGLGELERLDHNSRPETYRFVVRNAKIFPATKMILSGYPNRGSVIVRGAPDFVAVCWPNDNESIPDDLPVVEKVYW